MHYLSWRLSSLVSRIGFRFALVFWRASELFDKMPGFSEGSAEAYDRYVMRHAHDEEGGTCCSCPKCRPDEGPADSRREGE